MFNYCCATKRDKTVCPKKGLRPVILKCAEKTCENVIAKANIEEWTAAICGRHLYRFCSPECWSIWLKDASPNQSIMQFGSPNTPAIEPHSRMKDFPLIHI